ncbi:zinc-ribbon domain-containing protein [Clostridioides sp. ES-S-0048-02]|uniref:zinc-ribbon domain-containing protein n=1 Tax=Clostridioides sp. ES-S-0048-02 TaxID=2770777 RepID=UPI001D0F5766|nr:hypothetical protein [Clostridioides sp. ES-S-0048-02]
MAKRKTSFAEHHIENTDADFINKYWSSKNEISPYEISPSSANVKVWIKCLENKKHEDYEVRCSNFTKNNSRCPVCKHKKVHKVNKKTSFESKFPDLKKYWSNENDLKISELAPTSNKVFKFECPVCGEIFERKISKITNTNFIDKHMKKHDKKTNEYNMLNIDDFSKIVDKQKLNDFNKSYLISRYIHLFEYLKNNNKLMEKDNHFHAFFSEEDSSNYIEKYSTKETYAGMQSFIVSLNNIFKLLGYEVKFEALKISQLENNADKYLTKDELNWICSDLMNWQDKFILYAIWNGILGNKGEDLREIKKSDLDFETNTLKLKNRVLIMDDTLSLYAKETLNQKYYAQFLDDDKKNTTNSMYAFNMDSNYLIKTKPEERNNFGTNIMAYPTLVRRFNILNSWLNKLLMSSNIDINLSMKTLYYSGFMHKMKVAEENGLKLTVKNVDDLKNELGYKLSANNIKIIYQEKYREEE